MHDLTESAKGSPWTRPHSHRWQNSVQRVLQLVPKMTPPSRTHRAEPALSPRTARRTDLSTLQPAPTRAAGGVTALASRHPAFLCHLCLCHTAQRLLSERGRKSAVRPTRPPHPGGAKTWVQGRHQEGVGTGWPGDTSFVRPGLWP